LGEICIGRNTYWEKYLLEELIIGRNIYFWNWVYETQIHVIYFSNYTQKYRLQWHHYGVTINGKSIISNSDYTHTHTHTHTHTQWSFIHDIILIKYITKHFHIHTHIHTHTHNITVGTVKLHYYCIY